MSRLDQKGKRYEFLVERIDEALHAGYYVEAMSLTYSLFEDRTYRLLTHLGIPYKNKDKLYNCLQHLEKHVIQNNTIPATPSGCTSAELVSWIQTEFFASNLVSNIDKWRDERNDVIHDLAKRDIDYAALSSVAQEGRDYFRRYTALIMQLKKKM